MSIAYSIIRYFISEVIFKPFFSSMGIVPSPSLVGLGRTMKSNLLAISIRLGGGGTGLGIFLARMESMDGSSTFGGYCALTRTVFVFGSDLLGIILYALLLSLTMGYALLLSLSLTLTMGRTHRFTGAVASGCVFCKLSWVERLLRFLFDRDAVERSAFKCNGVAVAPAAPVVVLPVGI